MPKPSILEGYLQRCKKETYRVTGIPIPILIPTGKIELRLELELVPIGRRNIREDENRFSHHRRSKKKKNKKTKRKSKQKSTETGEQGAVAATSNQLVPFGNEG